MILDELIAESKEILRRYRYLPVIEIPDHDLEKFRVAYYIVQAALGPKNFQNFQEGIES